MPFTIIRQDITKMKVDAIVNAANTDLQMGGGVCGAIFKAAGAYELQAACDKIAPIKTGEAVITPGFALPAKYIIHTAGPIYHQWKADQCRQDLRSAYLNALRIAEENRCESIAFPLISSGIYGYPKEEALKVASAAIQEYLADQELEVYLAVFDMASFAISEKLLGDVRSYIDEHYVITNHMTRQKLTDSERVELLESAQPFESLVPLIQAPPCDQNLDSLINELDESFSTMLLRLIDAKGMTDVEVYKRANIDRKLFSKIRTGKGYMPSKRTALALAAALKLNLNETNDLLNRAGYSLSRSQKFDVIVEYFIINGRYDIFEINEVLFQYQQPLLGR